MFEIGWLGEKGWATNAQGKGIDSAFCGPAKVIKWIVSEAAINQDVVYAHGNSGGSMQISFGLAKYGLEKILDMVILTGGPPGARLDIACFGSSDVRLENAMWPHHGPVLEWLDLLDYLADWKGKGDLCKQGAANPRAVKQLKDASLVSPTRARDYSYPDTKVNFVNSIGDVASYHQAKIYYNKITSKKEWYDIKEVDHRIFNTEEGSKIIRKLFLNECKKCAD